VDAAEEGQRIERGIGVYVYKTTGRFNDHVEIEPNAGAHYYVQTKSSSDYSKADGQMVLPKLKLETIGNRNRIAVMSLAVVTDFGVVDMGIENEGNGWFPYFYAVFFKPYEQFASWQDPYTYGKRPFPASATRVEFSIEAKIANGQDMAIVTLTPYGPEGERIEKATTLQFSVTRGRLYDAERPIPTLRFQRFMSLLPAVYSRCAFGDAWDVNDFTSMTDAKFTDLRLHHREEGLQVWNMQDGRIEYAWSVQTANILEPLLISANGQGADSISILHQYNYHQSFKDCDKDSDCVDTSNQKCDSEIGKCVLRECDCKKGANAECCDAGDCASGYRCDSYFCAQTGSPHYKTCAKRCWKNCFGKRGDAARKCAKQFIDDRCMPFGPKMRTIARQECLKYLCLAQSIRATFTKLEVETTPYDGPGVQKEEWLLNFDLALLGGGPKLKTSTKGYYEVAAQSQSEIWPLNRALELTYHPSALTGLTKFALSVSGIDVDCDKAQHDKVPLATLVVHYDMTKSRSVIKRFCTDGYGRTYCVTARIQTKLDYNNCDGNCRNKKNCGDGSCVFDGSTCCTGLKPCWGANGKIDCKPSRYTCPKPECPKTECELVQPEPKIMTDQTFVALDIDGDTVVIGAPHASKAFIFARDTNGKWVLKKALSGAADEALGAAVAVHRGTVVVGAPSATKPGQTWVLVQNVDGEWESKVIYSPFERDDDQFGATVAIKGDILVVGALQGQRDTHGNLVPGVVCYALQSARWDDGKLLDYSAYPQNSLLVAIDDVTDRVAILDDHDVSVFMKNGEMWERQGEQFQVVDASDIGRSTSIAFSNGIVAATTPNTDAGRILYAVNYFEYQQNAWTPTPEASTALGESSILNAALEGTRMAVGSTVDVSVYSRSGNNWIIPPETLPDVTGPVAVSGERVLATKKLASDGSGPIAACVFRRQLQ
jgi:hypothetical protein